MGDVKPTPGEEDRTHLVVDVEGGALGSLLYTCSCGEKYAVLPDGPGSTTWRMMRGEQADTRCPKVP